MRLLPVMLTLVVYNSIYAQVRDRVCVCGGLGAEPATAVVRLLSTAAPLPLLASAPSQALLLFIAACLQMTTLFILQGEGMNTQLGSLKVAPATVSGKREGCSGCWLALSAGCSSSGSVNLTRPPRLTALLHLHFPAVLDCISVIIWVMLCECG